MPLSEMMSERIEESSEVVRERVIRARKIQSERFRGLGIHTNSMMNSKMLRDYCPLDERSRALLERAMAQLNLSARAHDRIIKVARTIADLAGEENISVAHISEAITYRTLDRESWGR